MNSYGYGYGYGFGTLILYLVVIVVVFIVLREANCWYWKINKRIEYLDMIAAKLDELVRINRDINKKLFEKKNN